MLFTIEIGINYNISSTDELTKRIIFLLGK